MKIKLLLCLLSFVTALYLLDAMLNKMSPDRDKPKEEARVAHKMPDQETQKKTLPKPLQPADKKEKPRLMVVQNALPPDLAAAIAASEKKTEPPPTKPPARETTPPPRAALPTAPPPLPAAQPSSAQQPAPQMMVARSRAEKATSQILKPASLAPETISIGQEQTAIGARLQKEGLKLPAIEASWSRIGFTTYLKMMKQVGGHMYVGDTLNQTILAEVELHYYNSRYRFLRFMSPGSLGGLALFRPREIVDEPLVNEILTAAFEKWPDSPNLAVVVLLPARVETGFLGSLKQYLESNAHAIEKFGVVRGEYFVSGNGLGLEVKTAVNRNTHQVVNLGLKIII